MIVIVRLIRLLRFFGTCYAGSGQSVLFTGSSSFDAVFVEKIILYETVAQAAA
jgi:hypothetical protein